MKKVKKYIRGKDDFGHNISLNFDQQGENHRTTIGGIFTTFINIFLVLYILTKLKVLINRENDST